MTRRLATLLCCAGFLLAVPGLLVCVAALAIDREAGRPVDRALDRAPWLR